MANRKVPSVRIVSLGELKRISAELHRIERPSVTMSDRAAVISWAAGYADCYFRTRTGALRRVFPKAGGADAAAFGIRKGRVHVPAGKSQAH